MKIKGIPVGTTMPRADLEQNDPKKADYVRGREAFIKESVDAAMTKAGEEFIPIGESNFGLNNTVTSKGYYIHAATQNDDGTWSLTLSMKQGKEDTEGMKMMWLKNYELSMKCSSSWYHRFAKIVSIKGNVVTVDSWPVDSKGNYIALGSFSDFDSRGIVATYYPDYGQVELCKYAVSFGYNNKVHTKGGFAAGGNNILRPSAGNAMAFGSQNIIEGSNAAAIGYNTKTNADNALATGMSTVAGGHSSFVSGYKAETEGTYSAAFNQETKAVGGNSVAMGLRTVANGGQQLVVGQDNLADDNDADSHFVVGVGKKVNGVINKKTGFRVKKSGETDICSNKVINVADGTNAGDAVNRGQLDSHVKSSNPHNITTTKIGAVSTGTFNSHANATNPHGITTASIGAVSEEKFDAHKEEFDAHISANNPHGTTWGSLKDKPITYLGKAVFTPSVLVEGTWRILPSAEQFAHAKFMIVTVSSSLTGDVFSVLVDMEQIPSAEANYREYPFHYGNSGPYWIALTRRYSWAIDFNVGSVASAAGCVPEKVCMYF